MPCNRPEQVESKESTKSYDAILRASMSYNVVTESARVLGVGVFVAGCLFPGSIAQDFFHLGKKGTSSGIMKGGFTGAAMFQAGKALAKAFGHSATASTMKNGFYTQRENVHEAYSGGDAVSDASKFKAALPAIEASATIAAFDVFATNYPRVRKVQHSKKSFSKDFDVPKPVTMADRARIWSAGLPLCGTKSFLIVGGFLMTPYLTTQMKTLFPENQHVDLSSWAATAITGSTIGIVANMLDVLYKHQVTGMDPTTFKVDNVATVLKNVVKESGYRKLFSGFITSVGYTVAAYFVVPRVEHFVDQKMMPAVDGVLLAAFRFFKPQPVTQSGAAAVAKDNQGKDREPPAPGNPFR